MTDFDWIVTSLSNTKAGTGKGYKAKVRWVVMSTLLVSTLQLLPSGMALEYNKENSNTVIHIAQTRSAESYFESGLKKQKKGDLKGAIEDYNQALKINPNYAVAYNSRGEARFELGDKQGAIEDYSQAIEINPNYATAYSNRAHAKFDLGEEGSSHIDRSESIRILSEDIAKVDSILSIDYLKEPDNHCVHLTLRLKAKFAFWGKQGGIGDYDQAIKINPNDAIAYYNRGNTKFILKDYQGSIKDYDQAIKVNPSYANAHHNRANAKFILEGNYKGVIEDYDQAIKINPNLAEAYVMRGFAKSKSGDVQGGLSDLGKGAKLAKFQGNEILHNGALNLVIIQKC